MVHVGDILPTFELGFVDPEAMKVWSKALRDPNPIHLDREAVKAAGLGDRRINPGPANVAYIINMLTAAFPGKQVGALDARFLDNVFEGEAVVAGGTVSAVDGSAVDCEIWLDALGRGRVVGGTARMVDP